MSNKLIPQGWVKPIAPAKPVLDIDAVKATITAMVKAPMDKREIVDSIQADFIAEHKHFKDSDIFAVIEDLEKEWHPVIPDGEKI